MEKKSTQNKDRILSLDLFRGMTVIGMILVNNPGSWSYIYSPLKHAKWNGCTPTDLVFPFFYLRWEYQFQFHYILKMELIVVGSGSGFVKEALI
ncbi:hypothetical protein LEP1GSC043_1684 [Leptospira weilii str. Ecochallenge]|uniref:DUF5009 domain-containing protein n=1 Tax=Leptospira weilii str. Ecochallenge TaxID=1049986 RepID=N1U8W8_9LEPT|nr:hypothetical protein LEP1GSC043_1684 [Leptospira weilii str. Ecochallenge]